MIYEVCVFIIILLAVFICKTYVMFIYYNMIGMPPGPIPLPVLGNIHQLSKKVHESLTTFARKYGSVMRILIGSEVVIVVSGTAEVLEGLIKKSSEFAGRKITYSLSLTTGGKGIAFSDYDKRSQFLRKIVHTAIRMYGHGKESLEALVTKESKELHKRIDEQLGNSFNIHHDLGLTFCNIAYTMVFGHRYEVADPDFQDLHKSSTLFVQAFEFDSLIDVFPVLRYLPNERLDTIVHALKLREPIIQKNIQEHKDAFKPGDENKKDLAYSLLTALHQAIEENSDAKEFMKDEYISGVLDDIMGAGSESAMTALRWFLVYLVNYPEIQEKCGKEIQSVVGEDQLPSLNHRASLPYVNAFIQESLRMAMISPLGIPHKATCDTSIGGYKIAKDTQVIFNLYAIHRDKKEWKNPYEFNPDRFLGKNGNLRPTSDHKAYLPFSAGRRVCVAEYLASTELFLLTSQLIAKYIFLPAPGCPLPSMAGETGLLFRPPANQMIVTRR